MSAKAGLEVLNAKMLRDATKPIFACPGIKGVAKMGVAMKMAEIRAAVSVNAMNHGPIIATRPSNVSVESIY
jgi:hypothetical protein